MLSMQQKRLRRENYYEDNLIIQFSEKTYGNKEIKLMYYGTIQDLYDYECQKEEYYDELY